MMTFTSASSTGPIPADRRSPAGARVTAVSAWTTVRTDLRRRRELAEFNRILRTASPNVRADMTAAAAWNTTWR